MLSATQFKEYAQLSQAAYAHFDSSDFTLMGGIGGKTLEKLQEIPNTASSFCKTEAEELTSRYEILHQYADNPDSNGFSATLFRDKETGHLVLGFRGTEFDNDRPRDLFYTDLRIGLDGYASPQAIAEYRYIKQLMTAGDQDVSYTEAELANLEKIYWDCNPSSSEQYEAQAVEWNALKARMLVDKGVNAGQGAVPLISSLEDLSLTGHSLGGHFDISYRRDGDDLLVLRGSRIELRLADFDFENGALGITLGTQSAEEPGLIPLPANYYHKVTLSPNVRGVITGNHADEVWGSGGHDAIALGGGDDYVLGQGGNDFIFGEDGKDYINGGPVPGNFPDDDFLVGGAGRDVIRGGGGKDTLYGGEIGEHLWPELPDSATPGDWLTGNEGNDELYGSRQSDLLQGGAGSDFIFGGAGDDLILGDGQLWQNVRFLSGVSGPNVVEWEDDGNGGLKGRTNGSLVLVNSAALTGWSFAYSDGRQDFTVTLGSGQRRIPSFRRKPESSSLTPARRTAQAMRRYAPKGRILDSRLRGNDGMYRQLSLR